MTRPLRIEFPGAVYHVTSRGDRREPIFVDDVDRTSLLAVLANSLDRFDALALAYCLMGNHYHLVLYTRRANLSLLMRQVNGVYTQGFNRRHGKVGHVFQGRFKAILVDREAYLLELCRYVELNPVRARMVRRPGDWSWSSYQAHTGQQPAPVWLDTPGLHRFLLGREASTARGHAAAASRYADWVAAAPDTRLWDEGLRQQIYLGDEAFVQRMQALASPAQAGDRNIPKAQRRAAVLLTLADWIKACASVDEAIYRGHREGGLTLTHMAGELGRTVSWASKVLARYERDKSPMALDAARRVIEQAEHVVLSARDSLRVLDALEKPVPLELVRK
jgi:putative transposase